MCGVDIGQTPRDFLFSGEPLSANRSPTGSSSSTEKLSCRAGVSMARLLPVHRMGEDRMGWGGIRQLLAARCPIFLSFHVPPPVCPHHDSNRMLYQGTEPVKAVWDHRSALFHCPSCQEDKLGLQPQGIPEQSSAPIASSLLPSESQSTHQPSSPQGITAASPGQRCQHCPGGSHMMAPRMSWCCTRAPCNDTVLCHCLHPGHLPGSQEPGWWWSWHFP